MSAFESIGEGIGGALTTELPILGVNLAYATGVVFTVGVLAYAAKKGVDNVLKSNSAYSQAA